MTISWTRSYHRGNGQQRTAWPWVSLGPSRFGSWACCLKAVSKTVCARHLNLAIGLIVSGVCRSRVVRVAEAPQGKREVDQEITGRNFACSFGLGPAVALVPRHLRRLP